MPYKNPELKKAYLERNREKKRATDAAYRAANPEILKSWREANKETRKDYMKVWRAANAEKRAASRKAWNAANPDKVVGQKSRRRQKYAMQINEYLRLIYPDLRQILEELHTKCSGICYICGGYMDMAQDRIELDHFIPVCLGGSNELSNLRATHRACNVRKGSKHPRELGLMEVI